MKRRLLPAVLAALCLLGTASAARTADATIPAITARPAHPAATASVLNAPIARIAVSKPDGLYFVEEGKETRLVQGESERPRIAPDGKAIAYLQGASICVWDVAAQRASVVCKERGEYVWGEDGALYYAPDSGGLFAWKEGSTKALAEKTAGYRELIASDAALYAYKAQGENTGNAQAGLLEVRYQNGAQRLLVAERPADWEKGELGVVPLPAAAGRDVLYVFRHYHSGSISADGVPLGGVDLRTGDWNHFDALGDTLLKPGYVAPNPKQEDLCAVVTVKGRLPWDGRVIRLLNRKDGTSKRLTPESTVAFAPNWSEDGKTLYYSASANATLSKGEDTQALRAHFYAPGRQFIYKMDIASGLRERLSDAQGGFDTQPVSTPDGVYFARLEKPDSDAPLCSVRLVLANGSRQVIKPFALRANDPLDCGAYLDIVVPR